MEAAMAYRLRAPAGDTWSHVSTISSSFPLRQHKRFSREIGGSAAPLVIPMGCSSSTPGNKSIMRYTAEDVQKHLYLAPSSDESELCAPAVSSNQFTESKSTLRKFDIYKKLVQIAEKALNEGSNYLCGIDACNEVLDGKGPHISNALRHECLCIRAALLLERKWKNDAYMAIKDCNKARSIYP